MKTETVSKTTTGHSSARGGDKKLLAPVTLFAAIEAEQHAALRAIAFAQHRSLADVVREALIAYLAQHTQHPTVSAGGAGQP
jgi:outer membrane protein TolC